MEKQVNGVIEEISFGNPFEGTYGETCRCYVKVNGESFSCYGSVYNGKCQLQIKKGDKYVSVVVGNNVIFDSISNEKDGTTYWNFKSKDMTIIASSGQQQAPPIQQNEQPAPQRTPPPIAAVPDEIIDNILWCRVGIEALIAFHGKDLPDNINEFIERKVGIYKKQIK